MGFFSNFCFSDPRETAKVTRKNTHLQYLVEGGE